MGPSGSAGGYAGVGRINCVEFHPTNNNHYWIGAPAGGLWVTTNNGSSWTCLTDFNNVLGISDIVVPPDFATSNTIYIATGDKNGQDNYSVGVLKSTDGGLTWNPTGLSYTINQLRLVFRLLMDPNDSQTIIAATSSGVFKTTDGGATWNTQLSGFNFVDLEYKPGDFNTLYGSTGGGAVHYSTNGGQNWNSGLTTGASRTEITVSPAQPNWVYAVVSASNNGLFGVYKSTDSGQTFTRVFNGATSGNNLLGWYNGGDSGGQGWYDLAIAVSPTDANTLLVGGVNTWRSTNGGTSWSLVNHWYGGYSKPAVHADKHMLRYRSNGDLFELNDGGIYISANNGTSWTDKTNGLVISQMYKLSNSVADPGEVITGLQDNGTKLIRNSSWSDVKGGDGMECLIDYSNPLIQYGSYVYGQISKTTNRWGSSTEIQPAAAGEGAWVTPYIIDPVEPATLYAGYADVWKTTNRGSSWTKISTMNTSAKLRSMAIAPSNTQVIYVADNGTIWKTVNGGTNWTVITGSIPSGSANITSIAVKATDPQTVWVSLSGYNQHGVYQTTNGGTSWSNISSGLPQIPMYSVVQNKQISAENQLYVGSELGVYFKKGTDDWILYNTNLPNVKIGELEIFYTTNPAESKLRAATYGRGLWQSPVFYSMTPMTYVGSNATQTDTTGVRPGNQNIMIIGMEVVTEGIINPLSLSQITITMTGTTNITDVSSVKVYHTGSDATFQTTTQFGAAQTSAEGNMVFSQTTALSPGINYFWVAYDLAENATVGNRINANFVSVIVAGNTYTPTTTNPGNGRTILGFPAIGLSTQNLDFGSVLIGTNSPEQPYILSGSFLNTSVSVAAPTGFRISRNPETGYTNFITVNLVNGVLEPTTMYVRFVPTAAQVYSGNINHTSSGATSIKVAVTGTGSYTSVDDVKPFNLDDITVYPNPSKGVFTINNPTQRQLSIRITDFKGRTFEQKTLGVNTTETVDLTNYPAAIYFVQFTVDNRVHNIRLVKE
jgi:photosystem II stability/assembly factor-like uncharacterized protein